MQSTLRIDITMGKLNIFFVHSISNNEILLLVAPPTASWYPSNLTKYVHMYAGQFKKAFAKYF
jgi:hypothetical protein